VRVRAHDERLLHAVEDGQRHWRTYLQVGVGLLKVCQYSIDSPIILQVCVRVQVLARVHCIVLDMFHRKLAWNSWVDVLGRRCHLAVRTRTCANSTFTRATIKAHNLRGHNHHRHARTRHIHDTHAGVHIRVQLTKILCCLGG
jgi:hypothetical protein